MALCRDGMLQYRRIHQSIMGSVTRVKGVLGVGRAKHTRGAISGNDTLYGASRWDENLYCSAQFMAMYRYMLQMIVFHPPQPHPHENDPGRVVPNSWCSKYVEQWISYSFPEHPRKCE